MSDRLLKRPIACLFWYGFNSAELDNRRRLEHTFNMRMLQDRRVRAAPVAIMLIATLAIVWHGAVSLLAHPLIPNNSGAIVNVASDDGHQHKHLSDATDHHAKHDHGKSRAGGDCCSTVSAVTLPAPVASAVMLTIVRLVRPFGAIVGVGLEPSTPTEPPSITYQC